MLLPRSFRMRVSEERIFMNVLQNATKKPNETSIEKRFLKRKTLYVGSYLFSFDLFVSWFPKRMHVNKHFDKNGI